MSGPVTTQDTRPTDAAPAPDRGPVFERMPSRVADVAGTPVHRALPRRGRRTVGAWCFADHAGPGAPAAQMHIGPHPHMGLQTVTWLVEGEVLHTDSLGSEQLIRPGQLNLMTAGRGVAHAEESRGSGGMHAVQLRVAQPEATRHDDAAFEHHAELPRISVGDVGVTVIVGALGDARSPARTDSPLVGLELAIGGGVGELPLDASFEHALLVLTGTLVVDDGEEVAPDVLVYLGMGRSSLRVSASQPCRALLLGGEPFGEEVLMWWNFVARTRDEVDTAYSDWQAESSRFGEVRSPLARIPAPPPLWMHSG